MATISRCWPTSPGCRRPALPREPGSPVAPRWRSIDCPCARTGAPDASRKDPSMSEENRPEENMSDENMPEKREASQNAGAGAAAQGEAEAAAAEGQYVEGDYGYAGTAGEVPPTAVEGEYAAGDYGDAGVAGAAVVGDVEGDYPEGDYGEAGVSAPEVSGESAGVAEEAEYPEGDYGTAGTAGPRRPGGPAAGEPSDDDAARGRRASARKLAQTTAGAGAAARTGRFAPPVRAGRNAAREAPEGLKSGEFRRRRVAADRAEGKVESMSLNFGLTYDRVWVKLSVDRSITVGPLGSSHCGCNHCGPRPSQRFPGK